MKKHKMNIGLIIVGIVTIILIGIIRIPPSSDFLFLLPILDILALGFIIFGSINYTELSLWAKIVITIIITPIIAFIILGLLLTYFPH